MSLLSRPQTIQRPPGPKDSAVANLYAMRRDPIGFFTKLTREYGDICHFNIGEQNFYLVNHPDMIKEVLVGKDRNFTKWFAVERLKEVLGQGLFVSEGAYHARQRKLSQPAFHRTRIAAYADTMVKVAQRVRDRWENGKAIDLAAEMNWLAMVIVADTLFGADVESEAVDIQNALSEVLHMLEKSVIPPNEVADFDQARIRLDDAVLRIIQERRAKGGDSGDLLSMLLAARDEDGAGMSDIELRDEAMTIFLAGHETTANALTWTWYLISKHPEIEKQLHRVVDSVLQGNAPKLEDISRLKYVEMIFAEGMRLYPPVWVVGRRAINDCEIGGNRIPAGSIMLLSQYITQHDARFFEEPEKFDPQRWTQEAELSRPKYSYFPFSSGSRQCLGEPFAWMEGVIALSVIAQKWQLKLAPGHRVEMQPQLTLRSKYGMRMVPVKR
ncbi:MAG: cytochrome P450 [Chthoniobacteraceae bacterium]